MIAALVTVIVGGLGAQAGESLQEETELEVKDE